MCARTLAAMTLAASLYVMSSQACQGGDSSSSALPTPDPTVVPVDSVGRAQLAEPAADLADVLTSDTRKATTSPEPNPVDAVEVDWNSETASGQSSRKSTGARLPFDVFNCPVTVWRPWFSTEVFEPEIGSMSPLPDSAAIPAAVLAELSALDKSLEAEPQAVPTHETYVAELMALVPTKSAWVGMNEELLDLGPAEQQPHFMNDLQALVPQSRPAYARVSATRSINDETLAPPKERVYDVPPPQHCEDAGDESLVGLFRPMGKSPSAAPAPHHHDVHSPITKVTTSS